MFRNANNASRKFGKEKTNILPVQHNQTKLTRNGGNVKSNSSLHTEVHTAEPKFSIYYDSEVEVHKVKKNHEAKQLGKVLENRENTKQLGKVHEHKENMAINMRSDKTTGAFPKTKNTGLSLRPSQVVGLNFKLTQGSNIPPPKPSRKDKPVVIPPPEEFAFYEDSPKPLSLSAENTPADSLVSEIDRGSSTCGISSQMKGIELSSAGVPSKKLVQVPFGELDISGKKKLSNRRPSTSSHEKDSEEDKENEAAVVTFNVLGDDVSPPVTQDSADSVDGLPTNCFAIPRSSMDKSRVSLHKQQEDDMCKLKEYAEDIFKYLAEQEKNFRPRPMYMHQQPDLAPHMRSMLVDWLVEVAIEYKLSDACLFMAVSYIDRFLSYNKIFRSKLQLLGTTAMFIAAKVEEIYPPESEEFVFITDNTYSKEQLLKMETFILIALDYRMTCVTPYTFFAKFVLDIEAPETVSNLALYLLELAMMEGGDILNYLPSVQAAASVALAAHTLMVGELWKIMFMKTTNYKYADLMPCMSTIKIIWAKAATHDQQAVRQKYLEPKVKAVASIPVCSTFPQDSQ
ncbi:unnamed protein product [Notodromas monacha]|uniref:Cyclin N-terminal domain-containing protein n=1 Tax=Notodromas monacha TaxID=399045 RepID=A0A7R9GG16_9CRUS|nr:unnamed protein product [Notodromas monacha]CAG0919913.1 unnamed protein product [Notodromas monacha]